MHIGVTCQIRLNDCVAAVSGSATSGRDVACLQIFVGNFVSRVLALSDVVSMRLYSASPSVVSTGVVTRMTHSREGQVTLREAHLLATIFRQLSRRPTVHIMLC